MDSILPSPRSLLQPQPPFQFSRRLPLPAFPNRRTFTHKSPKPRRNLISFASLTPPFHFTSNSTPTPSESPNQDDDVLASAIPTISDSKCFLKQLLLRTLFSFAIGLSALGAMSFGVSATAIAAPVANEVVVQKRGVKKEKGEEKKKNSRSHEHADCTDRLLETVSVLLRRIEEVRNGNGELSDVEVALKAVKAKKEVSRKEIMGRLYPELRVLKREKGGLVKRAGEIIDEILRAKGEYDRLKAKNEKEEKENARIERLEERVGELEEEYNGIWERVGEIEDGIWRKETVALSYGVREINFIERECEQLVARFKQEMKRKDIKRSFTCLDHLNSFMFWISFLWIK